MRSMRVGSWVDARRVLIHMNFVCMCKCIGHFRCLFWYRYTNVVHMAGLSIYHLSYTGRESIYSLLINKPYPNFAQNWMWKAKFNLNSKTILIPLQNSIFLFRVSLTKRQSVHICCWRMGHRSKWKIPMDGRHWPKQSAMVIDRQVSRSSTNKKHILNPFEFFSRPFSVCSLLQKLKQQAKEQMEQRRPNLVKALKQMGDFYMELKWDFQSWVPLVSRILPSDICKIHKSGCLIRLDTTLVDFSDMRWERGDISFIFRGDKSPRESLTVLDNEFQCYQRVRYEETDTEIEDEVDILMSSDILAAQMSTKSINFVRAQSGWIFREDKREMVAGLYDCDLYSINGLVLESRKRREHLSRDDLQKNKAIMESLTKGGHHTPNTDQNGEVCISTIL